MPSAADVLIPFYRLFKKSDAYPTDPIDGVIGCFGMGFSAILDVSRIGLAIHLVYELSSDPGSSDNLPKALMAIGAYTAIGLINANFVNK